MGSFFGFLRAGEATSRPGEEAAIQIGDVAVDSHSSPSMVCIHLRKSKTDPFGKGVDLFFGKTGAEVCPVAAILTYLVMRPKIKAGPLLVHADGTPLTREQFVKGVREALNACGIDSSSYSGHSFRSGAATAAAQAGVPAYGIKILGRWQSKAYHLYICTPRETLVSVASQLVSPRT